MRKKIDTKKLTFTGAPAPEFTLTSSTGEKVSVSDYKGKWLLIEFWASWCGPCRQSNPELVELYNTYHSKGFEILGVAKQDKDDAWRAAIEKDGLVWKQVNSEEVIEGQRPVCELYSVEGIPASFLIDPEGKVVGTTHSSSMKKKLAELFDK